MFSTTEKTLAHFQDFQKTTLEAMAISRDTIGQTAIVSKFIAEGYADYRVLQSGREYERIPNYAAVSAAKSSLGSNFIRNMALGICFPSGKRRLISGWE